MEVEINLKGLDKPCECGSGKLAGNCCRADEDCPCGSGEKAGVCCLKKEETQPQE